MTCWLCKIPFNQALAPFPSPTLYLRYSQYSMFWWLNISMLVRKRDISYVSFGYMLSITFESKLCYTILPWYFAVFNGLENLELIFVDL